MFYIYRSTTDKLSDALNSIVEAGDTVVQPVHTGGRDWVVVCRKGAEFAEAIHEQVAELRDAQDERKKYADLARSVAQGMARGSR